MSTVHNLHQQAMDLAEQADLLKLRGDMAQAQTILRQALAQEAQAAETLLDAVDAEPTRSILFRSAASLAVECGELLWAEKLIAQALAGSPPAEIAAELKDLFMGINLRPYLDRQGITLTEEQLHLLTQ